MSVIDRLMSKVKVSESGCIEYQFARDSNGYGRFWYNGQMRLAHRVAWELLRGPVPDGLFVCHDCDNPCCVNVEHLFLGTQFDNMSDCASKGRLEGRDTPRGESHWNTNLSEADVVAMRSLYSSGRSMQSLADEYGTTKQTVWRIIRRKVWAHVA